MEKKKQQQKKKHKQDAEIKKYAKNKRKINKSMHRKRNKLK